jgi:hypothetical protein
LARLLDGRADAIERNMARDPDAARRKLEMKIQAAIEKYGTGKSESVFAFEGNTIPDPGGSDAPGDEGVLPPPSAATLDAPAARSEPPLLIAPQPPAPPRAKTERELLEQMEKVNSTPPPTRYLKGPPEEWQKYIDADGNIHSPWFRPHG